VPIQGASRNARSCPGFGDLGRLELCDKPGRHNGEVSTRLGLLGLLALRISFSCAISASETSCVEPPGSELAQASPTALTVEPNPVVAGSEAMLSIAADGLPADTNVGAGAAWQCWNGSEWIQTHHIARGWGDGGAQTIELAPAVTITVPSIGLPVPSSYPIVIPDVAPGLYRIEDRVVGPGGVTITGFVFVEVRGLRGSKE